MQKQQEPQKPNLFWPGLSLFTSLGTLVCCALPALLVTLGAGAALAGLVSAAPWLVELSRYKEVTFAVAGCMLVLAGIMQWRSRNAPCPVDPIQAQACRRLRRASGFIYWGAVVIYAIGFFFAFVAADLFY
jgi:hypothetical protein